MDLRQVFAANLRRLRAMLVSIDIIANIASAVTAALLLSLAVSEVEGDFRTSTRDRNRISGVGGQMRLVLERPAEWDKLSVLIFFDSEMAERQSRFLPAQKRKLAKAIMMHKHTVKRNGRCAETGVRRT
jgi:hypothetical protein